MRYQKDILFAAALAVSLMIVWYAIDVFFLAFAAILLAILLHTIGHWTQAIIRLPYILSLLIALCCISGIFVLIFWLYSPLISKQIQSLISQLPEAIHQLQSTVSPHLTSLKKEFSFSSETLIHQALTLFSSTLGSLISFLIFLVVGFYLSLVPGRYLKGFLFAIPSAQKEKVWNVLLRLARSLRFWLFGKVFSMIVIGVLTFLGLWILNISLAFILGLLAGLLTFIPYVGAILAAIPAILIGFTTSPLTAFYVLILYIAIHILEGYLITPFIEQRTVSIPPALTIMGQILLFVLIGGLGLTLASPLIVVLMALIVSLKAPKKFPLH